MILYLRSERTILSLRSEGDILFLSRLYVGRRKRTGRSYVEIENGHVRLTATEATRPITTLFQRHSMNHFYRVSDLVSHLRMKKR